MSILKHETHQKKNNFPRISPEQELIDHFHSDFILQQVKYMLLLLKSFHILIKCLRNKNSLTEFLSNKQTQRTSRFLDYFYFNHNLNFYFRIQEAINLS